MFNVGGMIKRAHFAPSPPVLEIQWFSLSGQRSKVPYYVVNNLNAFSEGVPPVFCGPRPGSKLSASLVGSLKALNKRCNATTNAI